MELNPYINEIKVDILKRKSVDGKTHIVVSNNICLDYKQFNIDEEKILFNGKPIEGIYKSSLGPVLIVPGKVASVNLNLYVDYDDRIRLLKSISSRYLIHNALEKYFDIKADKFFSSPEKSTFEIQGIYFKSKADEIKDLLEEIIGCYIGAGLDIRQVEKGDKVLIDGIYDGKNLGPHLTNTSEVHSFKILSYEFSGNGVIFSYRN